MPRGSSTGYYRSNNGRINVSLSSSHKDLFSVTDLHTMKGFNITSTWELMMESYPPDDAPNIESLLK